MMANWCVVTGFPPEVYKTLTLAELEDFYNAGVRVKGLKKE